MTTLTGQTNDLARVELGLHSLDYLLGNHKTGVNGMPLNTILELYGANGVGKSTLAMFIAGRVTTILGKRKINIADLEASYEQGHTLATFLHTGFNGEIHFIESVDKKRKARSHEEILDELANSLGDKDCGAAILDSLGVVMPQSEVDNPIGSSNWGKRAFIVNQTIRRMLFNIRNNAGSSLAILVNHSYADMGGRGHITPGGNGKGYASAVRLLVWKAETFPDGSTLLRIKAEKLRYGGLVPKLLGLAGIIPGYGVSPQLTAVFDCVDSGLAERTKSGFIKLDGVSMGRLGKVVERAVNDEQVFFQPFFEKLKSETAGIFEESEEVTEDE